MAAATKGSEVAKELQREDHIKRTLPAEGSDAEIAKELQREDQIKRTLLRLGSVIRATNSWEEDLPIKDWKKIVTDHHGNVISVDFHGQHCEFKLEELDMILGPHLRVLDLHLQQQVSGDLSVLSGCERLIELYLGRCKVFGSLNQLSTCVALKSLELSNVHGVGGSIELLRSMPELEDVRFTACPGIGGPLDSLAACPNLRCVMLDQTAVQGSIDVFKIHSNLVALHLEDTQVTGDIAVFSSCPQLQTLLLFQTGIEGDVAVFESCHQLEKLNLRQDQPGCG